MPARRVNPHRVKQHRSYSVPDLATCLNVHKNTIRNWQREGLEPVDATRPILFHGAAVRDFLIKRNKARRRPCPTGTFYCLPCRTPRAPAKGRVEYLPMTATSGNLRAFCECCGRPMYRRARRADIAKVMPGYAVQLPEAPTRIVGKSDPSLSCDLEKEA